jgi:hypothetical protein
LAHFKERRYGFDTVCALPGIVILHESIILIQSINPINQITHLACREFQKIWRAVSAKSIRDFTAIGDFTAIRDFTTIRDFTAFRDFTTIRDFKLIRYINKTPHENTCILFVHCNQVYQSCFARYSGLNK